MVATAGVKKLYHRLIVRVPTIDRCCAPIPLLVLLVWSFSATLAAAPAVVVSILPLHSLVASVMAGIDEPALLQPGGAPPHGFQLRPSQMRTIASARLVFRVGSQLESWLDRPLRQNPGVTTVDLIDASGLRLLDRRSGGAWEFPGEGREEQQDAHDHWHSADIDPHIWLDPVNAVALSRQISSALQTVDPGNADAYRANTQALIARLKRLDARLSRQLGVIRDRPFIVFHDAFQYFEVRYDLTTVGSITLDPEHRVGARRVGQLLDRMQALEVRCVFSEPQYQAPLVRVLLEGSGARAGELDPLGSTLIPGGDAYFELMNALGNEVVSCLGPATGNG